jgi:pSer/pThr/pTyr-binding forkhead associated (FHA) protein
MNLTNVVDRLYIKKLPGSKRKGTPIDLTVFPYRIGYRDGVNKYKNHFDCSSGSHQLSRNHCEIVKDNGGILHIRDFGSRLGTYVNGKQIDEEGVELHNGDVIGLIPTFGFGSIMGVKYFKVELVYQTPLEK